MVLTDQVYTEMLYLECFHMLYLVLNFFFYYPFPHIVSQNLDLSPKTVCL